jgi:uncharacterized protein
VNKKDAIGKIERKTKNYFSNESTGHDWWHSHRVRQMGLKIGRCEEADLFVVEMAALLHDVGDYKFHNGDEEIGSKVIKSWLIEAGFVDNEIKDILEVITYTSFMKSLKQGKENSKYSPSIEAKVVSDSDRLDAIGAIGIARAFAFGGAFNRKLHNPNISPRNNMNYENYKTNKSTTINHFYEKLLNLKDSMFTETGKKIAQQRHEFMERYLEQFFNEWDGNK